MHQEELPVQGEGIGENMKYCVDNSLCPFKRQSGSIMECSAVEYCAYQRPNSLLPYPVTTVYASEFCQCGYSTFVSNGKCLVCGRLKINNSSIL